MDLVQLPGVKDEVDVDDLFVPDCEAERGVRCSGSDRPDGAGCLGHECG